MSREIKFRVWDKKAQTILQVATLHLSRLPTSTKPLMQYTGLKDKNGKEIYEGDIVHWFDGLGNHGMPFIIEYYEAQFILTAPPDTSEGWYIGEEEIEVIGNVFENPELLKIS